MLRYGQYGQIGADGIWRYKESVNKKGGDKKRRVILQRLSDYIEMVGSNRDRRYKKK